MQGKLDTEDLLESKGINYTSVRPVYIYGPLNYNPVEEWFFHRIKAGRPIPVPNTGLQVPLLQLVCHLIISNSVLTWELELVALTALAKQVQPVLSSGTAGIMCIVGRRLSHYLQQCMPTPHEHFIDSAIPASGWCDSGSGLLVPCR